MEIFRFTPNLALDQTLMENGVIVNGLKSKLWVERFTDAGEFKFVANVSSGAQTLLPIGSLISHTDATEVMIVEDHQIADEKDKDSDIVITGRSVPAFLENRTIYDTGLWWSIQAGKAAWRLTADYLHNQVMTILNRSLVTGAAPDRLLYFALYTPLGNVGPSVERPLNAQDTVYTAIVALMKIGPLGIKSMRPGPWTPWSQTLFPTSGALIVHAGVDVSNRVFFSSETGEIVSADYLWSSKTSKNVARVVGQWNRSVQVEIPAGTTSLSRRVMPVDGTDIYQGVDTTAFTPADWAVYDNLLTKRGEQALAAQKALVLTRADIAPNLTTFRYRTDYNIGDLVTVNGKYNTVSKMRVIEHVEVEDETGSNSYPTLAVV